jgi:hypothetical protein
MSIKFNQDQRCFNSSLPNPNYRFFIASIGKYKVMSSERVLRQFSYGHQPTGSRRVQPQVGRTVMLR